MMELNIVYEGDLRTKAIHPDSGAILYTDAPKDNQGKGEAFSPTDLLGVSLGSCALTLMGIASKKWNVDLTGSRVVLEKTMLKNPRRIGKIVLHFYLSTAVSDEIKTALEKAALECPVHHSLDPAMIQEFHFHWERA